MVRPYSLLIGYNYATGRGKLGIIRSVENLVGWGSLIIFGMFLNGRRMIHVKLPDELARAPRRLPFYLAMEEHLARNFSGEYFFMWQVAPTVIFGRNQIIDTEVNLDYCRREGIDTCRRKSGGGCVFADMNNIMFSHITTCRSVATTFTDFTSKVAGMLCRLGLDACTTGRNDILIGDRKVSGYAFYHIPVAGADGARSRAVVHGTMLHDTDMERMTAALTPSVVKLKAKGVESVRAHVTTIKEHSPISLDDFKRFTVDTLCDGEMTLTADDVAEIERIAAPYYEPEWIYGRRRGASAVHYGPRRVEGAGEFVFDLEKTAGEPPHLVSFDLKGDFFLTGDLDGTLLRPLSGVPLDRPSLTHALADVDVGATIAGLTTETFIEMLLEASEMHK